jgi:hypothetical protein
MSLIYGHSGPEVRPHVHVCLIGGRWLATFRGGDADSFSEEGIQMTFPLPYRDTTPADELLAILQRQNPGSIITIDQPVLA